jgi:exodeoxyribonuclease V gamma subunit
VDVDVDLGDGRRLTGTVGQVHGAVLASTSYSSLGGKHRLTAWVRLLALAAHGAPVERAVTTGRGRYGRPARSVLVPPEDPLAVLRDLVALRDEGLRAPLPVAPAATAEFAARRSRGGTVEEAYDAACAAWDDRYGDRTDDALLWATGATALTDLAGPGFEEAAARLWAPLLGSES